MTWSLQVARAVVLAFIAAIGCAAAASASVAEASDVSLITSPSGSLYDYDAEPYGYDDTAKFVVAAVRDGHSVADARPFQDASGGSTAPIAVLQAPNTTAAVARVHRHHTVPSEILRQLPDDVANHPLVRGRAGAPNRWPIPEDVHRTIHSGPGGGAYNQAWKDAFESLGRSPTVDDVLQLRGQITKQFGIDVYRPY